MMKTQHEMQALLRSLTEGLGLDRPDLDLFDMALEEEFSLRLGLAVDLYQNLPERLLPELEEMLWELGWLETRFVAAEEYERAAIAQAQRGIIERKLLHTRKKGRARVSARAPKK